MNFLETMMMKVEIVLSPAVEKFIKKLKDKPLKKKFHIAFQEIQQDPYGAGERKTGDLAGVFGYDIYHQGTNYELAYTVQEDEDGNLIFFILAGTREQFYQELKRYIKATKIHKRK